MHCSLLHEADDLVLYRDRVVHIVIKLHLHLVLQLSVLLKEVLVLDWIGKVLIVLRQQVDLAVVGPRVEPVAHGVLRPNAHILATSEQQQTMDLLVQALPVEHVGHPGETVREVQEGERHLPGPVEGVHEEDVPREWHQTVVHAVWVLEVDG